MKTSTKIQIIVATWIGLFSQTGFSQVPALMNYQGFLTDPNTGLPKADSSYQMVFSIYSVATGGAAIWSETHNVQMRNGLYSVMLGSVTPLASAVFTGTEKYLGIRVGVEAEMVPRKRIVSVAYSLMTEQADKLDGKDATDFAAASHAHDERYVEEGQVNAITSSMIQNGTITGTDIAASTIEPSNLNFAIPTRPLNPGVSTAEIANNAVDSSKIAVGAVTSTRIQDGTIRSADIAANAAIPESKLALNNPTHSNANDPSSGEKAALAGTNGTPLSTNRYVTDSDPRNSNSRAPSGAASGDLSGTYPNPTVAKLQTRNIASTAPTTGQVLKWDGAQWKPDTDASGGPPSGTAGGDLTGIYPNPTIANDAVNSAKITNETITNADITANAAISESKLALNNPTHSNANDPSSGEKAALAGTNGTPSSTNRYVTDSDPRNTNSRAPSGAASGDLAGTYPNPTVAKLQTRNVSSTAPVTGQVLKWDGAQWKPDADASGGPPSGTAGGDLTGTYPNPTIANNTVDSSKIAVGAVTSTRIQDGTIRSADIAANAAIAESKLALNFPTHANINDPSSGEKAGLAGTSGTPSSSNKYVTDSDPRNTNSRAPTGGASGDLSGTYPNPTVAKLQTRNVASTVPTTGQVLKWDGTQWKPDTDASGGPPSGTAGGDLIGTYPNPTIANDAVNSAKIVNETIANADIAANAAIAESKLALNNPTHSNANDPSSGEKAALAGTSGTPSSNNKYVTDSDPRNTNSRAPTGGASGDLSGTYPNPTVAKLQTRAVSSTAPATGQVLKWDGTQWKPDTDASGGPPSGTAGGDLTGIYPNPTIANNAVNSNKIQDGTVDRQDLANNAVDSSKIAVGAVTSARIQDGTIRSADVAANAAITESKLALNFPTHANANDPSSGEKAGLTGTSGTPSSSNRYVTDSDPRNTNSRAPSGAAAGDLSGTYPNPTVAKLQTRAVSSTTPVTGQVLKWDGAQWKPDTDASGGPPSGTAGGDLTGTYPNPTIANDAVNSAKILNGTIANGDIAANAAIAESKLALSFPTHSNANDPSSGEKAGLAGTSGTPSSTNRYVTDSDPRNTNSRVPTGTAGGDLTGTFPNPTIANNVVNSSKIQDGTVITQDLANNAVDSSKIAVGAVTSIRIQDGTIRSADIAANAAIAENKLALSFPTHSNVNDPSSGEKAGLAGTNGTPSSANRYVTNSDPRNTDPRAPSGAASGDLSGTYPNPTVAKLQTRNVASTAPAAGQVLKWDGTQWRPDIDASGGPPSGSAGGDLTGAYPNPTIANNTVTSAKIQDGTIQQSDLAFQAGDITDVTAGSGLIGGGTVGNVTLSVANNGITSAMIQSNAVTASHISANIVSSIDGVSNDGGDIDLVAGSNITITPNDAANTITITATGGGVGNTLDQAYDQGGPGAGRTIIADAGAVNIAGPNGLTVNGGVGIGTTSFSPGKILTIVDGDPEIQIRDSGDPSGTQWEIHANAFFEDNFGLVRYENGSPQASKSVIVTNNGNVGIGATSPLSQLHVKGNNPVRILGDLSTLSGSEYVDFMARNSPFNSELGGMRIQRNPATGDANTIFLAAAAGTGASEKMRIGGNGNIGIGTTSPIARVDIAGNADQPGTLRLQNPSKGPNHSHVHWDPTGDWYIRSAASTGRVIIQDTGGNVGIGTSGPAAKLHSIAGATGTGVRGEASGQGVGVYGQINSPGEFGLAGYFIGDVQIVGGITKSSGTFQIDHPLDPANKYLLHSFVESPDMMNVYNGNVELDKNGEATVELPNWFEALNKDFRYQLTCIGGFAPVYIAEEISGNHFKIAGGKAGLKVSWQVTGIRHDRYAEEHRIQVEVNKSARERGFYLHPELYGQPKEKSVALARYPESTQQPNKQQ